MELYRTRAAVSLCGGRTDGERKLTGKQTGPGDKVRDLVYSEADCVCIGPSSKDPEE